MLFQALVVNVMIASPSDVKDEREIIRETIHKWNVLHAEGKQIVLLPVGWETHSSPTFGDRPQAIVNKQVLERCELLIAVFWTRIGTPTGEAASGTVEEITKHVESGKEAMIYFSNAPFQPDDIDHEQRVALKQFREWCERRSLIESYSSLDEFAKKLDRQLTLKVNAQFVRIAVQARDSLLNQPGEPHLSPEAQELLVEASHDRSGAVMMIRSADGLAIQTNNRQFGETGDPRSEAKWKAALDELVRLGLLEERGYVGQIFAVTDAGFRLAEALDRKSPAQTVEQVDLSDQAQMPRPYLEVLDDTGATFGQTPFVFTNRGGDVAHDVQVQPLSVNHFTVTFDPIPTIAVNEEKRTVPTIPGRGIMQQHDILSLMVKEWDEVSKARQSGATPDEWATKVTITYADFKENRFEATADLVVFPIQRLTRNRNATEWPKREYKTVEVRNIKFRWVNAKPAASGGSPR